MLNDEEEAALCQQITRLEKDNLEWFYIFSQYDRVEKAEAIAKVRVLEQQLQAAREALKDIFAMMEEGLLVRNTDHDEKPDWAIRNMQFVQRLQQAQAKSGGQP